MSLGTQSALTPYLSDYLTEIKCYHILSSPAAGCAPRLSTGGDRELVDYDDDGTKVCACASIFPNNLIY
jgi:hypothetical protein